MITVILVIHLLLAIGLIGVVLLQKSEGGALGMGGGGMSGFMTGRTTANLLTRTTAVLAGCFFLTSIGLAVLAAQQRAPYSVLDQGSAAPAGDVPAPVPSSQAPVTLPPQTPAEPSAPLAK
jgi:preprotein translocase subunit SecG